MSSGVPSTTLGDVPVAAPAPTGAALSTPYAVRQIRLTFQLGAGPYGQQLTFDGSANTITLSGLRVICHVDKVTFPQMGSTLVMKVYGMSLDHMNALSKAGLLYDSRENTVLVEAGDAVLGLSTVFRGIVNEAFPSLDTAEDAHFHVVAQTWPLAQLRPVAPTSYPGAVSAASAIQAMATVGGFNFQNDGVTAVLSSPYFPGTVWQQVQSAVRGANCFAFLDDTTNTLVIWPKNAPTPPTATLTVSPQTGMIGYPKFQQRTIIVRMTFSPQYVVRPSLTLLVRSSLAAANNARLRVTSVAYDLASQMPDGPWEATIEGSPPP